MEELFRADIISEEDATEVGLGMSEEDVEAAVARDKWTRYLLSRLSEEKGASEKQQLMLHLLSMVGVHPPYPVNVELKEDEEVQARPSLMASFMTRMARVVLKRVLELRKDELAEHGILEPVKEAVEKLESYFSSNTK